MTQHDEHVERPQRQYRSAVRARQATETRNAITREAERLFLELGYEPTTIGAIAAAAEVAPQTVYAVFGSKKGILKALFERNIQAESVLAPYRLAMETSDPREALGYIAGIACHIFSSMGHLHEMLRGSCSTSPELHQLMLEQQQTRYDMQVEFIRHLFDHGHIRADYDFNTALDTFWCLVNQEPYRLLVQGRGWDLDTFRRWFTEVLVKMLLKPAD